MSNSFGANRWGIAAAGVFMQIALGAVYAWSVFRLPLAKPIRLEHPTNNADLHHCHCHRWLLRLFLPACGSTGKVRASSRMTGGFLYGLGIFLASFSNHGLWWLYLSYGLIGGIGLGFAYIVPVAVLVKWFPDRRGLITGIAVGGFGAGPLITRPIATHLIQSVGVLRTVCLPWVCVPRGHRGRRLLYAESAARLEARRLAAQCPASRPNARPAIMAWAKR